MYISITAGTKKKFLYMVWIGIQVRSVGCDWLTCLLSLSLFQMFIFEETERQSEQGREKERGTEDLNRAPCWQPDAGLELTNRKIMTWVEVWCLMDWATQVPLNLLLYMFSCIFLPSPFLVCWFLLNASLLLAHHSGFLVPLENRSPSLGPPCQLWASVWNIPSQCLRGWLLFFQVPFWAALPWWKLPGASLC